VRSYLVARAGNAETLQVDVFYHKPLFSLGSYPNRRRVGLSLVYARPFRRLRITMVVGEENDEDERYA
jgi:hypothetical protein